MKFIKNLNLMTKGFTLIEIIVVLVILGILAALALQNYFDWIKRAKVAEAIVELKALKDRVEPCVLSKTNPIDQMLCLQNIANNGSSENFTYEALYNPANPMNYVINAVSVNSDPAGEGSAAACEGSMQTGWLIGDERSGVTLCRKLNGTFQIIGFGLYKGIY